MSLYGVMRTGVSGMNAQSSKLSTVADNIANSSTTGYKRASTEFSSMILDSGTENYNSGGVNTRVRHNVSEQGNLSYTTSVTDLAVSGNGFMIVTDGDGTPFLTRAGSFVPDGSGNLVNAAGFYLMGFKYADGDPAPVAGGLSGLQVVNVTQTELQAVASTEGEFSANLPAAADIVAAADLPSTNVGDRDLHGEELLPHLRLPRQRSHPRPLHDEDRRQSVGDRGLQQGGRRRDGRLPLRERSAGNGHARLRSDNGRPDAASPHRRSRSLFPAAPPSRSISGKMVQLSTDYRVLDASVNGNAPSPVDRIEIDPDGTLFAIYESGARVATYKIPLADVPSPDNLTARPGNVYAPTTESGAVQVGFSTSSGLGTLISGALEASTVDLASELTAMIESQRSYTANSKVFQTGSELLDVLVNMKR